MAGFASIIALAGLVEVLSTVPCPRSAMIADELRALGPAETTTSSSERLTAVVEPDPDKPGLRLTLRGSDGRTLASRQLAHNASCSALAQVIAVVITTWSESLQLPAVVAPPPPPSVLPTPQPTPLPTTTLPTTTPVPRDPPSVPPKRLALDVGAALLGSLDPAKLAVGGLAELTLTSHRLGLGGRVALWGTQPRELSLMPVTVTWWRVALSAELDYRRAVGRWHFDAHAGIALALLDITAPGYRHYAADPGLTAGVRAAVQTGSVAPFVEVGVIGWLRGDQLWLGQTLESATLDRFELLLAIGVGYAR